MRMPVLFMGHGSPMYAIEPNEYTLSWEKVGQSIPSPKAILMISAHWYTRGIWLTAMNSPKTIHDFGGFPDALFQIQYPCPGSPALANRVQELLAPHYPNITLEESEWGIDHGSWSILKYMYPNANLPVIQMSIDATLSNKDHFAIGRLLQALRDEDVLIISSGNIVHNLRLISWNQTVAPPIWATGYNDFFKSQLIANIKEPLVEWENSNQYARMASPSPEHYLPAIYTLGLKDDTETVDIITDGIEMSSISMLSFGFGL